MLGRLIKSRDGTMAAEFAIASSVAIALVFAAIDVGRLFIINGLLGDAARQISRENQVQLTAYDSNAFTAAAAVILADRSADMFDPALVSISTTVYDSFDDLAAGAENGGAPPGGDPGQIVKYRLTYTMDYYTPFIGMLMETANFNHTAEIIVYNEPETTS